MPTSPLAGACASTTTAISSTSAVSKRLVLSRGAKSVEHQMNHGQVNHGFARQRRPLPVHAQPTTTTQPRKRPLHDPTLGQRDKTLDSLGTTNDFQVLVSVLVHPDVQAVVVILLIGPHQPKPCKPFQPTRRRAIDPRCRAPRQYCLSARSSGVVGGHARGPRLHTARNIPIRGA